MFKKVNYVVGLLFLIGVVSFNPYKNSYAGELKILEPITSDEKITVFLKGGVSDESPIVQIGTVLAEIEENTLISGTGNYIYSLVLVDNSKSIGKSDRTKTRELISDLIVGRMPNEKIAIATCNDDQMEYLCDFIDDGINLQNAMSSIKYKTHKSYLTDILLKFCKMNELTKNNNIFLRIIVISDGSDRDGGRYRIEELDKLLSEKKIPIYAVYCSEKSGITDNIKWFTSLARETDGEELNLTATNDLNVFVRLLQEDSNLRKLIIIPKPELMDGTERMIKISIGSQSASQLVIMPQNSIKPTEVAKNEGAKTEDNEVYETDNNDLKSIDEKIIEAQDESSFVKEYFYYIIGGIILILVGISGGVYIIIKRHKNNDEFEKIDKIVEYDPSENLTVIHKDVAFSLQNESNAVQSIFQDTIRLTCLTDTWEKQLTVSGPILIGRSHEKNNCIIDIDPTISREQCEIIKKNNKYFIKNKSKQGTKIDGAFIVNETEILSGTVIEIGSTKIRFDIV